jgi:phosphohistidine phosphatase
VDPELETGMTPQASRCHSGPVQDQGSTDAAARRRVAVMRHGKAEPAGRTDFERELAERGRLDSADTGSWLAEQGFVPDLALVSAARRTIGTWESVAAGGGFEVEPRLSQVLYGAGPETCLDLVRELPSDATSVIVVGHNPTMAYLASLLDDGEGDPAVSADMMSGYPTSAVALFEYDGEWADLAEAGARLVAYHVGRG